MSAPSTKVHAAATAAGLMLLAGTMVSSGCTIPGPAEGRRACVSWKDDVGPLLQQRCVSCHGGPAPAGTYDLSTYRGVLGHGTDARPNVAAGDPSSPLLTRLGPDADADHLPVRDVAPTLEKWVMECGLEYSENQVHPQGWVNRYDDDFHGTWLRSSGWDFAACQKCHGDDFKGGKARVSCWECHRDGPQGCTTCHRDGERSGQHDLHLYLAPKTGHRLGCEACHDKPAEFHAPGHVFLADGTLDPAGVEVHFGAEASRDAFPDRRQGPPTYDGTGCSNIACHGDTLGDANASSRTFTWRSTPSATATCNRCHGKPPVRHPVNSNCVNCHPQTVDAAGNLVSRVTHLDGTVQVGPPGADCESCHRSLPFRGLGGQSDTAALPAGAHDLHLSGSFLFGGKFTCAACHRMPRTVGEEGHVDTDLPVELFAWGGPDGPGLAAARGATPSFDRETGTCSNIYCHGGGTQGRADTSPGIVRELRWTDAGRHIVGCGSCHGIPPRDANHTADMQLPGCARCHPDTVDGFGHVITHADGTSLHVNGVVNVTMP